MYKASVIAYAFVKKGIEDNLPVTQMKLQKLVYFAHGLYLAKTHTPLVEDGFEAWQYGPVAPSIYQTFKKYGAFSIRNLSDIEDYQYLDYQLSELDPDAKMVLQFTWDTLKNLDAVKLSNWTHSPGSPWKEFYRERRNVKIEDKKIDDYFQRFISK